VNVVVNGVDHEIADGSTVADAASLAGIASGERGVAIAVSGVVVARAAWEATTLQAGQRLEIVRATAGG
jgi:thiamine biosynthesis protein ThiS